MHMHELRDRPSGVPACTEEPRHFHEGSLLFLSRGREPAHGLGASGWGGKGAAADSRDSAQSDVPEAGRLQCTPGAPLAPRTQTRQAVGVIWISLNGALLEQCCSQQCEQCRFGWCAFPSKGTGHVQPRFHRPCIRHTAPTAGCAPCMQPTLIVRPCPLSASSSSIWQRKRRGQQLRACLRHQLVMGNHHNLLLL